MFRYEGEEALKAGGLKMGTKTLKEATNMVPNRQSYRKKWSFYRHL